MFESLLLRISLFPRMFQSFEFYQKNPDALLFYFLAHPRYEKDVLVLKNEACSYGHRYELLYLSI